jgi:putative PIN family toxin of toxin-antitoxin system
MRLVLDTNVLVSALLGTGSPPSQLFALWSRGRYQLLTADLQLEELRRVTRYPKIRKRLRPAQAGELVNALYELAERVEPLPAVTASPDPADNVMLAIAQAGEADYVVSGDKRHLLSLERHGNTRIVTVRTMLEILEADK